jgi:hypothetical protein
MPPTRQCALRPRLAQESLLFPYSSPPPREKLERKRGTWRGEEKRLAPEKKKEKREKKKRKKRTRSDRLPTVPRMSAHQRSMVLEVGHTSLPAGHSLALPTRSSPSRTAFVAAAAAAPPFAGAAAGPSALRSRLQNFLPALAQANVDLSSAIATHGAESVRLEIEEGSAACEQQHIEMSIALAEVSSESGSEDEEDDSEGTSGSEGGAEKCTGVVERHREMSVEGGGGGEGPRRRQRRKRPHIEEVVGDVGGGGGGGICGGGGGGCGGGGEGDEIEGGGARDIGEMLGMRGVEEEEGEEEEEEEEEEEARGAEAGREEGGGDGLPKGKWLTGKALAKRKDDILRLLVESAAAAAVGAGR